MFHKKNNKDSKPAAKKDTDLSVIAQEMHVLGNIVSDGMIDFNGTIDGNIRGATVTIRPEGTVKGEIIADNVFVFGKVQGLIRAKSVHLYEDCHVEGIVMHEMLTIEDGAFLDGKCKRTDKIAEQRPASLDALFSGDSDEDSASDTSDSNFKMMENIRLIR